MNTEKIIAEGIIPPPLPLLPKNYPEFEKPKCPVDHIKFM